MLQLLTWRATLRHCCSAAQASLKQMISCTHI